MRAEKPVWVNAKVASLDSKPSRQGSTPCTRAVVELWMSERTGREPVGRGCESLRPPLRRAQGAGGPVKPYLGGSIPPGGTG